MDHSEEEDDIRNINDSSQLIQEHDSVHASYAEQRARQMDDLQVRDGYRKKSIHIVLIEYLYETL